ncbi:MAG: aminotransferase DegT [Candidatus Nanohalarchaeota archaeon]|nr:MAG: aminotransferase DegT [Candidatus Nanohaloarchaeota archaeon]
MIPVSKPLLDEKELGQITEVINSGMLAQGPKVKKFEDDFAKYIGTKHAIATNSGSAALHVGLLSAGIGRGDEVITTPFTFIATANSILYCNAKPVFADVNEGDFNIDPAKIEEKITSKTKALLAVHLYGQPCNMDKITDICNKHNLSLIEDACQAHGAEFNDQKVGSFGTGCFSFYPTKNMTTGEGGMITTNSDEIAKKARIIRNHGSQKQYFHEMLGYNYRMTDIAAAIGISQLKKLESFIEKRISNANYMTNHLQKIKGIIPPKTFNNRRHVFNQYTIRITDDFPVNRGEIEKVLKSNDIGYGIYYPLPINRQPIYEKSNNDNFPVSERLCNEVISLPIHPSLDESDLDNICTVIEGI